MFGCNFNMTLTWVVGEHKSIKKRWGWSDIHSVLQQILLNKVFKNTYLYKMNNLWQSWNYSLAVQLQMIFFIWTWCSIGWMNWMNPHIFYHYLGFFKYCLCIREHPYLRHKNNYSLSSKVFSAWCLTSFWFVAVLGPSLVAWLNYSKQSLLWRKH